MRMHRFCSSLFLKARNSNAQAGFPLPRQRFVISSLNSNYVSTVQKLYGSRLLCIRDVSWQNNRFENASYLLRNNNRSYLCFSTSTETAEKPVPEEQPVVLADLEGEAIIGTPVSKQLKQTKSSAVTDQNQTESKPPKKKFESEQERLIAKEEKNSLTLSKALNLSVHYFFVLDGYAERFVKGTMRVTFTLLTRPWMFFTWSKHIWEVIKKEARHYWAGFKLLGEETKTSYRLIKRKLHGHELTRRERKQLLRTSADLLRVIPVSVFIIVPFMEFFLPIALKIFPNLLPSTFQSQYAEEEKSRKLMKLRIEYVGFFQEMSEEMARKAAKKVRKEDEEEPLTVEDIETFFEQLRMGKSIPEKDIYRVAKIFDDDNFLNNMSRAQLVLVCRYMGLTPYGGDQFLRFQLRNKISSLREDDRQIYWEGVDVLNMLELKQACQDRGMRATGLTVNQLRRQLSQWLELSVNKRVSTSLLILSRAYTLHVPSAEVGMGSASIGEVLGGLDPELARTTLAENVETLKQEGVIEADRKTLTELKLEAIKKQNEIIKSESARKEKRKKEKENEKEKEKEKSAKPVTESEPDTQQPASVKITLSKEEQKLVLEPGKPMEDIAVDISIPQPLANEIVDTVKEAVKERMGETEEIDVTEALEGLKILASDSPIADEKKELEEIVEKMETMEGDRAVTVGRIRKRKDLGEKEAPAESSGVDKMQQALQKNIQRMLEGLEKDVQSYDKTVGDKLKLLDLDKDGLVSCEELRTVLRTSLAEGYSEAEIDKVVETLDLDRDGIVSIEELTTILEKHLEMRDQAE